MYNTNESFQAKMIAIEFDKIYAVSHPGRSRLFGFGLFCGSNGYWRADLLRAHKMNGDMLTEDIDSALRAYVLSSLDRTRQTFANVRKATDKAAKLCMT